MIRKFREEDREIFINLSKQFYNSSAVCHQVPVENFNKTFDECKKNGPYCYGVAVEFDNKVVGFGLYSMTYSNEAGGLVIWLEELYIMEEYRSKGLGKEFFEYVYNAHENISRYRLEITKSNTRAYNLYKRLGYVELEYLQMIKD